MQATEHRASHGQESVCFARARVGLVVFGKAARAAQPSEGALDHPAPGQGHPRGLAGHPAVGQGGGVAAKRHDLHAPPARAHPIREGRAPVAAVRPDQPPPPRREATRPSVAKAAWLRRAPARRRRTRGRRARARRCLASKWRLRPLTSLTLSKPRGSLFRWSSHSGCPGGPPRVPGAAPPAPGRRRAKPRGRAAARPGRASARKVPARCARAASHGAGSSTGSPCVPDTAWLPANGGAGAWLAGPARRCPRGAATTARRAPTAPHSDRSRTSGSCPALSTLSLHALRMTELLDSRFPQRVSETAVKRHKSDPE